MKEGHHVFRMSLFIINIVQLCMNAKVWVIFLKSHLTACCKRQARHNVSQGGHSKDICCVALWCCHMKSDSSSCVENERLKESSTAWILLNNLPISSLEIQICTVVTTGIDIIIFLQWSNENWTCQQSTDFAPIFAFVESSRVKSCHIPLNIRAVFVLTQMNLTRSKWTKLNGRTLEFI